MQSNNAQDLPVELFSILPKKFGADGASKVIPRLRQKLVNLKIQVNEKNELVGLDQELWLDIYKYVCLSPKGRPMSKETQRRYKEIILEIATIWRKNKWIRQLPELKVPQKHPRHLTVRIDLLGEYLFSDFLKIIEKLKEFLSGKNKEAVVPEIIKNNQAGLMGLLLILNGLCRERAVAALGDLCWSDIPEDHDWPIHIPHPGREGYFWFWPFPLVRLMIEAIRPKGKNFDPTKHVFSVKGDVLLTMLNDLLENVYKDASVPVITVEKLIYWTRLHVRQVVNDATLAVWIGLIPFRSKPPDQCTLDQSLEGTKFELNWGYPANSIAKKVSPSEDSDLDSLMMEYDCLLEEIWDDLNALFEIKKPQAAIENLNEWLQTHQDSSSISVHNLTLLITWLISIVKNGKKRPGSRRVYWYDLKRLWIQALTVKLEEFDEDILEEFAEDTDYSLASRRQSIRVWRWFENFLIKNELKDNRIGVVAVRGQDPENGMVRVLTRLDQKHLYQGLTAIVDKIAVFLAMRVCLRVSEVCKLVVGDFELGLEPYVFISKSKGGKSRRAGLSHLTPDELAFIKKLVEYRKKVVGVSGILLADEDGNPLVPKYLSERVSKILNIFQEPSSKLQGQPVSFHSLRRYGLNAIYQETKDLRASGQQAGHAQLSTTSGSYMSDLDLDGVEAIKKWRHPLNNADMYIPVLLLGSMLRRTDRRLAQMIDKYNLVHEKAMITILNRNELSIEGYPTRHGKPEKYISVRDGLRLLKVVTEES